MATVLRSDLYKIVLAVQARLMLRLGWPAERVLVADPRKFVDSRGVPLHPQADQYLVIWLADQGHPDMPVYDGAGRWDTRMTVRLAITLRTRFFVDEVSSSLAWLTDASLGHLEAVGDILNALVEFTPTDTADDTGNWHCVQGLNPAPVGAPEQEAKRDPEWGSSVIGFIAVYEVNLNPAQD